MAVLAESHTFADFRANEYDLIQVVIAELAAIDDASYISLILESITFHEVLLDLASILHRAGDLDRERWRLYLTAALKAVEGSRVMRNNTTLPRHPFVEAKILLLASQIAGDASPLKWAERYGLEVDDLEYAHRRVQSAHTRSVGSFRDRIEALSRNISDVGSSCGLEIPSIRARHAASE
jgi:hypothetical protein